MKKNLKKAGIITLAGLIAASPVTVFGAQTKPEVTPEEKMAAEIMDATNDLVNELGSIFIEEQDEVLETQTTSVDEEAIQAEIDAIYEQLNELYDQLDALYAQLPETESAFEFTPEQEAIWDKIDAVYDELNTLNEENSIVWVKLYGDVTERFDKDFDEKEYIEKSKILSDDEKELLIDHIEKEEALYAEISDYWVEYFRLDDPDYEATDDTEWNKIRALSDRSYSIRYAHPDLWDKIEWAIYKESDRNEDIDYAEFIQNMESLTDEDKELALKDLNVRNILDEIVSDMIISMDAEWDDEAVVFDEEVAE